MRSNIKILITVCLLVFTGLCCIQYYLIRNTYNLTKKEYIKEIETAVNPIVDADSLDVLQDQLGYTMKDLLFLKLQDSISEKAFYKALYHKRDSIKELGDAFLKSKMKVNPLLQNLRLKFQYTEIVFVFNGKTDTIVNVSGKPLMFFGTHFSDDNSFSLNTSTFYNTQKDDKIPFEYIFSGKYNVTADITNWRQQVLWRMSGILTGAGVLLFAVVFLFFKVYQAYFKQKKIADIKTDFANNITHELKTPLTSLDIIIKTLRNNNIAANEEKRTELFDAIERQNKRMQSIVDRVLESSMIATPTFDSVEVVTLLQELTNDFPFQSHQFKLNLPKQPIVLQTDAYILQQVCTNLLENAIKYTPESGLVQLTVYQKTNELYIEVSDTGQGIPSKELVHIFEKFYRVSEGNTHNVKGLGLGLFVSKQLVAKLNGKLLVKSQIGKGSTFTIVLKTV